MLSEKFSFWEEFIDIISNERMSSRKVPVINLKDCHLRYVY
jgi:hypothetical protein